MKILNTMKRVIFMGIAIFALAGLIVPMTIQTSYANDSECKVGEIAPAALKPIADRNENGLICVIKEIDTPRGTIVVAIDDTVNTHDEPCPDPPCGSL